MTKLINEKDVEIKESAEINDEVSTFYRSLCEARDLEECDIEDLINRVPYQHCHPRNQNHWKKKLH